MTTEEDMKSSNPGRMMGKYMNQRRDIGPCAGLTLAKTRSWSEQPDPQIVAVGHKLATFPILRASTDYQGKSTLLCCILFINGIFISFFSLLPFLLTLPICLIIHVAVAEPVFASFYCPDIETVAPNSEFQSNVDTLLSLLNSTSINDNHFYNTTVGSGANKVYGSFFCRIDQTIAFCQECISLAINSLNYHCPGKKNFIVWYDQCMLRYSNGSFFGIMNDSPMVPVWEKVNDVDMHKITSNMTSFTEVVLKTLGDVSYQAATSGSGKKFSTKEARFGENLTSLNIIYSLAECTPDISVTDCTSCLHMVVRNMTELCNKRAGCTVLNPSCHMKVGMQPFYGDALSPGSNASHVPFFGVADPVFASFYCPDIETVAPNSEFQSNVNMLLSLLNSTSINDKHFYNTTVGNGANKVYGSLNCRNDQTIAFCQDCISLAINSLNSHCPGKKNFIVWYDQCMLRYSNDSFFGKMNDSPMVPVWENINDVDMHNVTSNITNFSEVVLKTLGDVSYQAATNGSGLKFSTKEEKFGDNLTSLNIIYSLAECTPDISVTDCTSCLHMIVRNMTERCNKRAGCTVLNPSCHITVGMYPFYGDALSPGSKASHVPFFGDTPGSKRRKHLTVLLGILISAILVMVIVFAVWFCACRKTSKLSFIEAENQIEIEESLKFDLTTIRKATNNFSAVNKLGEGGFGEVYKGKLDNGQRIAIKRLSRKSKQGIDEFKTEVVLVAKLQHRNLVKLLGFCLSGKEKILVYEFLPNMSLDRFLSDVENRASLNWKTRCKILKGIARGLLYLHEDSRLKIIHRDLKPSNILLDESMNPKIADFGTAKLFGVDQTQDNTDRIVGTLGYMAPEYLIAGHFSVKSDVYSFGILILELVSGVRNKYWPYQQTNEALLIRAWRSWNEEMPLNFIDPTLGSDFEPDELSKCIHIGLLCIQEDAAKRPRMASIVGVLNGEIISLPSPTPPRFFGASTDIENQESFSGQGAGASGVLEDVSELYAR